MSQRSTDTLSVVVERALPAPQDTVWRALTDPALIARWLMPNDFEPVVGRPFKFTAEWGSVDCQVLAAEPDRSLSYTWAAFGLESVVRWTLAPTDAGTFVRMEQSGFRSDQPDVYDGAHAGWQKFVGALEELVAQA